MVTSLKIICVFFFLDHTNTKFPLFKYILPKAVKVLYIKPNPNILCLCFKLSKASHYIEDKVKAFWQTIQGLLNLTSFYISSFILPTPPFLSTSACPLCSSHSLSPDLPLPQYFHLLVSSYFSLKFKKGLFSSWEPSLIHSLLPCRAGIYIINNQYNLIVSVILLKYRNLFTFWLPIQSLTYQNLAFIILSLFIILPTEASRKANQELLDF